MALAPQAKSRSTEKMRPVLPAGFRPTGSTYTYGSSENGGNVAVSSSAGRLDVNDGETACHVTPLSVERMTSVRARRSGNVGVGKSNGEAAKKALVFLLTPVVGSAPRRAAASKPALSWGTDGRDFGGA